MRARARVTHMRINIDFNRGGGVIKTEKTSCAYNIILHYVYIYDASSLYDSRLPQAHIYHRTFMASVCCVYVYSRRSAIMCYGKRAKYR